MELKARERASENNKERERVRVRERKREGIRIIMKCHSSTLFNSDDD
jgi:hypothetical protein